MAGYDRDQLNTIRTIRQVAQQRYGNDPAKLRRYLLTNYEIGDVESSFHNLKGGDADSEGYRQERASIYKNPTNLKASINRAFDEMEQHDHGQSTGELAADVQRPAAQNRGKYQVALPTARALATGASQESTVSASGGKAPKLEPGSSSLDAQGAVSAALLDPRKKMSLASRILENVQSGKYTTTTAPKATAGTPAKYQVGSANATVSAGGASSALAWAESKLGDKETGTNSGGLAGYANKRFDLSNQPWCAMFTSLAVTKGGAPKSARTASVAEVRRQATVGGGGYQKGFVSGHAAQAGDLILFGDEHIGMVKSVSKGRINYVGGNQSNSVTEASVPVGGGDIVRPKYR